MNYSQLLFQNPMSQKKVLRFYECVRNEGFVDAKESVEKKTMKFAVEKNLSHLINTYHG